MSENYLGIMTIIISGNYDENYEWELSPSIKVSHGKVEIYKNQQTISKILNSNKGSNIEKSNIALPVKKNV